MFDPAALITTLRLEQRASWQRGQPVRVEAYLERHPSLRANPSAVLDLVANEVALHQEQGKTVNLADYVRRFEDVAPDIEKLLASPHFETPPDETSHPNVPGYTIVRELGRGGMGVVYEARQENLKRTVALKMIIAGGDGDALLRTRFVTEAQAVARLQHPNIVQIHEVGRTGSGPFLALEYVDGGNLASKNREVGRTPREAAALVEKLALAVQYMHQRGILHRDLKPANVLLTRDGAPKITDFGLAKLTDDGGGMTRSEAWIGTPNYMSPEQAAGNIKQVGIPSDVYSLGAILYELLTGQAPFRGNTVLNTLEQVQHNEPAPPSRCGVVVSRDLETICLKCLEKDPARRYPSAQALADDLRRFLDGAPVQARPIPSWLRLWRSARRRPKLAAAIGAGVAALCILAVSLWSLHLESQLGRHRVEENHQKFLEKRDQALLYGVLTPEHGSLFLGSDAEANRQTAEAAAREALALAGVDPHSDKPAVALAFPERQRLEMKEDCYALLLVMANAQARGAPAAGEDRRREAFQLLDAARKLGFETRAWHSRRADLLARFGDADAATKAREQAEATPPTSALDYFLLGEEQYRLGQTQQAMIAFHRALGLRADYFWAEFYLAMCHLKAEEWETARAGLNSCLARHPGFIWGYVFRSIVHEKLREPANADTDFAKALELNPNDDARYVLYLTRGIFFFNRNDPQRAEGDFRSAIALKPRQYNAYLNLAGVHLAQGRFETAADELAAALQLDPPTQYVFDYQIARASALLRFKQPAEALEAAGIANKMMPTHPLPFEMRGRAMLQLGKCSDAEQAFDKYLRCGGEWTSDIFRGRGHARMQLGRYVDAVDDYSRALQRAPDAEIYLHRGWAYFFSDAWRLAQRDFATAIDAAPHLADAYVGRGLSNAMLGSYREALADADAAIERKIATGQMMHNTACILALCAANAAKTADDASGRNGAALRARAIEVLKTAVTMLRPEERAAYWRDKIVPDVSLASIRDEPQFRRLGDELKHD